MKKTFAILLAAMAFVACSTDDVYDLDYFTQKYKQAESSDPTPEPEPTPEPDTLYVAIAYNGATATVTGDVDKITVNQTGADVTITSTIEKFLQVTLSGTTTDGSLLVNSERAWGLVLNGVSINNQNGSAINNQGSKWLYVTLVDGTENTLSDGETYAEQSYDQKGVFFSEGQMQFLGKGTLTVKASAKNGIACDDYIVIDEGTINVNTDDTGTNGIKTNDGFTINGGTLTINVKADGGRGIKCDARTTINGGQTTITTIGDCEIENVDGVRDTTSAAGIKSDSLFVMNAGTLTITSKGDGGKGINCSENVEFKGGTLNITTTGSNDIGKPKGIKSDTGIIVSGGSFTVNVKKSWALDNGNESEDPADRITIEGSPTTKTLQKRSVVVVY
jgi:hypothetical protein